MNYRKIQAGDTISIHYILSFEDNVLIGSTEEGSPLIFTLGDGTFPTGIDQLLIGMEVGEQKKESISPEAGWGYPDPNNVQRLPASDFPDSSILKIGNIIEFKLPNADDVAGTILNIQDEYIEVDFNPPLSGHTVNFVVSILSVDASC